MNHGRSYAPALFALLVLAALAVGLLPASISRAFFNGQSAALVLGQENFSSHVYGTTQTQMDAPQSVAVDPTTGRVFVADSGNNRVLRFTSRANLSNGAAAEGVLGQPNFTSNTPALTAQGLNKPKAIAVDTAGRLWVADSGNNRVLRFDNAASKLNGAAADGVLGETDFTRNDAGLSRMGMVSPSGLAVEANGRLWVADTGLRRVLRFDNAAGKANGANADGVLGQSDFVSNDLGISNRKTQDPHGLAVDASGRLWVVDIWYSRVVRFDNAASKANGAPADGVLGQPDFVQRNWAATAEGMSNPVGAAVDANGTLWVADMWSNRVLRFDNAASKANGAAADGVLGQSDFTGATSRTDAQGMQMPLGIGVWGTQWLWVADTGNHRVTLFDLSAQPTATPTLTPSSTPTATSTTGPGTPTATAQPTSTTGPGTPTATAQPTATTVPSGLVPRAYLPWLWVR